MFRVEERRGGEWVVLAPAWTVSEAANLLVRNEQTLPPRPRRVVNHEGSCILAGRYCSRDTPVNDVRPLWIVLALDKPGPCERGERAYKRHATFEAAKAEARRLSQASAGGRFGVLTLQHVTGWIETTIRADDDLIPF